MGAARKIDPNGRYERPFGATPYQLAYSHAIILDRLGMQFSDVESALEELYEASERASQVSDLEAQVEELTSDLDEAKDEARDEFNALEKKYEEARELAASLANEVDALRRKVALIPENVQAMGEALDIERADHGVTRHRLAEAHAEIGVLRLAMAKPKRAPRKAKAV